MNRLKIGLAGLLISVWVAPQAATSAIENFENSLVTLKPFYESSNRVYDFKNFQSSDVRWTPNIAGVEGIDLFFNGMLGLEFSTLNGSSNQNQVNYGSTSAEDIRFSLLEPSFDLLLDYQSLQGLYVSNSAAVDATTLGGVSIQSSSFSVQTLTIDFNYTLNPEVFSLRAASEQTVRQSESGGSPLFGLELSQISFSNGSSFIPQAVRAQFGVDQNASSSSFYTALVKAGYGYTIVILGKWFATAEGTLAAGPQYATYSDSTSSHTYSDFTPSYQALLAGGFNGDRYFTSLRVLWDQRSYRTDSLGVQATFFAARLSLGARF